MKGRAPNWSNTGSHTEVRKKLNPKVCRGKTEPRHNSKTNKNVSKTTEAANRNVISRAISSPSRRRNKNEREPATGPAPETVVVVVATLLNIAQGLLFLRDNLFGEFRVGKCFRVILPVGEHPTHKALERVALSPIREFRWNK